MQVLMSLYVAVLFIVLTPGVLLSLPKGGSKLTVAAVHGLVFALVYRFTYSAVARLADELEGFQPRFKVEQKMKTLPFGKKK